MSDRISYTGNKDFGYTARMENHSARCKVVRVKGGWQGSYHGSPTVHNQWYRSATGGRTKSCTCPVVTMNGTFRTRRSAAINTLRLARREDLLNMQGKYAQARAEVAERASVQPNAPTSCTEALGYSPDGV